MTSSADSDSEWICSFHTNQIPGQYLKLAAVTFTYFLTHYLQRLFCHSTLLQPRSSKKVRKKNEKTYSSDAREEEFYEDIMSFPFIHIF